MAGLPAAPDPPVGFWLVASTACLVVAASRSIGWLRYVLPVGWLAYAVWAVWADVSVSGLGVPSVLMLLGGVGPLLGWLRRPVKGQMEYPFPLREAPMALLFPDAHRIISTAAAFDNKDNGMGDGDNR